MHLHKSYFFLLVLLILFEINGKAQQISQIGIGNYGMVHSLYLNPSMPAYGKYNWQINLSGFWVNANNNYLNLKVPYSLYRIPNRIPLAYQTESGNASFNKNWLVENLNGRPKHLSVLSDVYGLAASFRVKKWTFGVFTQASAGVRVTKLPESLAHAIVKEFDSTQGAFNQFNNFSTGGINLFKPFSVTGNSRINLGVNAARAIKLDWNSELLVGISIKKVWGMPGFFLSSDGLKAKSVSEDSIVFSESNMQLISFGEKPGKGWGTDIGATYVFNKKDFKRNGDYAKTRTNYFCKLGFSILDIGSVKYKDASFNEVRIKEETGIKMNETFKNNISNNSNYQAVADSFMSQFASFRQYQGKVNVGLPTRLVLSSDFQIKKHFFIAAVVTQSLRKRMSIHSRYQSYVMVAPRLEYRYFEISLPVMQEYDYRAFRAGLSMRIGPVYIGTNSLLGFVNTRSLRDADLFAGIAFGNLSEFGFRKQARNKKQKKSKAKQSCGDF